MRKLFTEYYQHNEKFEILFLINPEYGRARLCISCKLAFLKDNPVVPDGEQVIMRKERHERTVKDSADIFPPITITNHLGRKFYCTNKNCFLGGPPYFWRG